MLFLLWNLKYRRIFRYSLLLKSIANSDFSDLHYHDLFHDVFAEFFFEESNDLCLMIIEIVFHRRRIKLYEQHLITNSDFLRTASDWFANKSLPRAYECSLIKL